MPSLLRNVLFTVALAGVAYELDGRLWWVWYKTFIEGTAFSISLGWIHWHTLVAWAPHFIVFLVLGALLSRLVVSARPVLWCLGFGAALGLVFLIQANDTFTGHATLATRLWAYGTYLMPVIGSVVGAAIVGALNKRTDHGAPNQPLHPTPSAADASASGAGERRR